MIILFILCVMVVSMRRLWTSDFKDFVMGSVFDDHWLFSCNDVYSLVRVLTEV